MFTIMENKPEKRRNVMGKTGLCGRVREEKIGIWAATLRGEVGKTRGEDEEHLIDGTSRTWKCTFILRKVQIFT